MEYINLLILFSSVLIGSLFGYFLKNKSNNITNYLLVFSGGFLLSITILEIFPHLYKENNNIGIWIIIGVLIQIFLEYITKGIEHGHVHSSKNNLPLSLFIGLFIHSFIEGLPILSEQSSEHAHNHSNLVWAIFIHNLPISFILSYYLFKSKLNIKYSILMLFIFSLSSPLSAILGTNLHAKYTEQALAIVAGIFLHISSLIIFESNKKHNFNLKKLISILIGLSIGYLIAH